MNLPKSCRALLPTEDAEQISLFQWAEVQSRKYPELCMMYHTPNGGRRSKAEAGRFRSMGVKPGVPDIFLPVSGSGFPGLFIELKRQAGGRVSKDQKEWILNLRAEDYAVEVCKGWAAAAAIIVDYLEGRYTPLHQLEKE